MTDRDAATHLSWLFADMQEVGDLPAVIWRDRAVTYRELCSVWVDWTQQLDEHGVGAGDIVAVVADYTPASCSALLALIDRGAIVVPLAAASAAHHDEFLDLCSAGHVIRLSGDEASFERREADVANELLRDLAGKGGPGLIVFSSGSTGKSKGMVHDVNRLLEKFRVKRQRLTTLTFLLFDHLGGINTLLYVLSNGGTIVTTDDRDPEVVCALIERHGIQLLPVSPTFLGLMLLSGAHRRHDMSSLKIITYGTEVMPQATLDRVATEFPDVKLQQTYGLSEVGALRTKSRDNGSLWLKVGGEGVETKVHDGRLMIRSTWAMLGYINAPQPFDEDGWFDTQDEVEVDGEYIKFLGRVTDIINVGGNKVYPAEVESALLRVDNIRDAVAFAELNPLMGQVVAAQVVVDHEEPVADLLKRVRNETRQWLERFMIPVRLEIVEQTEVGERFKKIRTVSTGVDQR